MQLYGFSAISRHFAISLSCQQQQDLRRLSPFITPLCSHYFNSYKHGDRVLGHSHLRTTSPVLIAPQNRATERGTKVGVQTPWTQT